MTEATAVLVSKDTDFLYSTIHYMQQVSGPMETRQYFYQSDSHSAARYREDTAALRPLVVRSSETTYRKRTLSITIYLRVPV